MSVVIAAWNERENLETLTRRLHGTLSSQSSLEFEILYVLAGEDGSLAIAERLREELGRIRVVHESQPRGLGAAFRTGFAMVAPDSDVVLTMDADLNHQPEEIPRLLEAMERSGADVVIGSRAVSGSVVTGTPLWKRTLSGALNVVMRALFSGGVRDKTSGFRLYRASVVRNLRFAQDDFSFLPEIVIQLQRSGHRVVEEPIHFIYRTEGKSKMQLLPTSLSYLSLLRGRVDRLSLIAALILLGGIALRFATAFPVHKYPADADALLSGLCACDVLGGDVRVFFNQTRLGALECYATAAVFLLFGISRASLALVSPLLNGAMLLVAHRFFRLLLGRPLACVALLFLAFPSPAELFWLYMPNSYPSTLLVCAAILWLAARAERSAATRGGIVALGVAVGLGIWTSFLTVMCAAPALLWIAWRRRDLHRPRWIAMLIAGIVLGALPWIAFNIRYPLESFHDNFGSRPASTASAALSNAKHVVSVKLPELVASVDPERGVVPPSTLQRVLRVPVLAIHILAIVILAITEKRPRRVFWLVAGLILCAIVLNTFSEAGETRVLAVRYVLPAYFGLVIALAWFLAEIAKRSKVTALAVASVVLVFNVAGYHLPGEPYRLQLEARVRADEQLIRRFEQDGTQFVLGDFWRTYPFNFLTRERVLGVPCTSKDDPRKLYLRVPDTPSRWVALTATYERKGLDRWMRIAGVSGTTEIVGEYLVFRPDRPSSPRQVLRACGGR